MDVFVEQLIAEQRKGRYFAIIFSITLLAVLLVAATFLFAFELFAIVLVAVGYGWWWAVKQPFLEYEYSVTNGDIDIDRIRARSKRLRLVSVRGEKIESLAPVTPETDLSRFDRVVRAVSYLPNKAQWCFTYHSKKNGRTAVVFEPNARVLNALIDGLSYQLQREVRRNYQVPAEEEAEA